MTSPAPTPALPADARLPRLALASRGDALTPFLSAALERRYPAAGRVDPELHRLQRLTVAGLTFRPSREAWVERFYKSGTARAMRSRNARRALGRLTTRPDAILQVHVLFDAPSGVPSLLYIDCTHHQSAAQWAPWNPLRGRALNDWYRREQDQYDRAAHLFAFSAATRRSLIQDYGQAPDRVTVVGAGANVDALPPLPQRPGRSGPPTLLFIGHDFARKGGPDLLRAFRRVRAVLPDARLRLVGQAPPVEPEPGVEVLGRVHDRARIAALYAEADVFVLPSVFDPLPLVVLEAMALGVPVVTTRQTGTPDVVDDGVHGLLVPPGDVTGLTAALLSVLQDRALGSRLRLAARARVESELTWDAVVDRMAPALDTAIRSAAR